MLRAAPLGMSLVLGGAHSLRHGFPLAHERAPLGAAEFPGPGEVVDPRPEIGPDDVVRTAAPSGLRLGRELVCARNRGPRRRRQPRWRVGGGRCGWGCGS